MIKTELTLFGIALSLVFGLTSATAHAELFDVVGSAVQSSINSAISSTQNSINGAISSTIQSMTNPSLKRQGIFGCNQSGSYSMSVGTIAAKGGVYVPVNDASVTLNSGTIVYKECILRDVVNRQRENEVAKII